ncbi:Kinase phosphorylation family protein [Theileria parva strain Muguga]|nr:Kinase phosphorylation family protein [Theileria parva strain Muguga]EAN30779.2 Kinase phosphorylation family protein [Theileria parva strain Muguga]
MIDLKLSPPREGTRGGREQFKWEDLKSHDLKDREHYLGHSVKVGLLERKNKFYKHDWYLKKDSKSHTDTLEEDEAELTRLYEQEIMQEMLGAKPRRLMLLKSKPTDPKQLK